MPRRSRVTGANGEPLAPRKNLFDDSDPSSEDDQEDGGAKLGGGAKLKINEAYARRFEHNKKREELHRLEEKFKSKKASSGDGQGEGEGSEESSDDETEDDEGFLATEDLDAEISATLQAIKNKDPRIYDKDAVFYKPFDPDAVQSGGSKEKPVTLQDYHRQRYLQGDTGAEGEDEGDSAAPRTYAEEQDDLKKNIVSEINAAAAGEDSEEWSDDDAFIKPKNPPKEAARPAKNGVHPSRATAIEITELDVANADKNPDEYLSKFMASRAWAEGGSKWEAFESDDGEDDNAAEEIEHAYNMRFEDPEKSNEVLTTYSRNLAASRSARKEEVTGRKKQRLLEKEKKAAEKKEREEERARLRRLKIEEAGERLAKIKKAAGMSGKDLKEEDWIKFLDDAWEDEKWEEAMRKQFGEDYYAEADNLSVGEDEDEEDDGEGKKKKKPKKPKWDDDIDIGDIIPDFDGDSRPDIALTDSEQEEEPEQESESDSEGEQPKKKRKTGKGAKQERIDAKREARRELANISALIDSKMEIDNPRLLASKSSSKGGAAAPLFRYRETSPNSFGMTARDILLAPSDAALNDFVGLKKLATFREPEKKRKDKKRLGKKARLREWRRETFGREFEQTGPTYGFERVVQEGEDEPEVRHRRAPATSKHADKKEEASNVVDGERKKKRKRKSKGKGLAEE